MGEYCGAVKLLLARMDSNPEEFTKGGRWDTLIAKWKLVLPAPDRMALESKLNTLWLEVFHKEVMSELLAEPNDYTELINDYVTVASGTTSTIAVSPYSNAVSLSSQSIKEIAAQLQQYASNTWKK